MGVFTKIPQDTFTALQLDAGVLLYNFNPANPAEPADEDIICATTGGINAVCTPTYSDFGEDVDNAPTNMKELKHLDGWECTFSTTSLGTSVELLRLALGAADISGNKVTPRRDLQQTDFSDIWWVGDRADGGMVAVKLINALSTGGLSLQTTKNGKGQISITLTGHVSIDDQDTMPMEWYSAAPSSATTYRVTQFLTNVTSNYTDRAIAAGESLSVTLTADEDYTIENAVVIMGSDDITDAAYSAGSVAIASVTGDVTIFATANAS